LAVTRAYETRECPFETKKAAPDDFQRFRRYREKRLTMGRKGREEGLRMVGMRLS
jgi:hypothetical protein